MLANNEFDLTALNQFVREESTDLEELRIALGFSSQSEFLDFQEAWKSDLLYLEDTYQISELDSSSLADLIASAPFYQTQSNDNCDRLRRNCVINASAVYTLEALGCSALNLTVIGGVICYGVITAQYLSSVDTCTIQWEQCNE